MSEDRKDMHPMDRMEAERMDALKERAIDAYRKDRRFHATAQSIVAHVMREHGRVDPERADREASDIALDACALLLKTIYENDEEISRLVQERDIYKGFAEQSAGITPMPMISMDVNASPKPSK